jgi:membrane-anchored glycerophosphoryl diester phosphodiesterase (GDPDase)
VGVGSILFTLIGFGLLMFFDSNRIATLIGALLLVLAVLLFFGYILIVIYNGYRLILAMPIFVANKYGVLQCLKKSWDLTRGNVLSVFISVLIVSLMIFGVTYVISFPASIYSLFLELNAANTATVVAAFDPIYLILLIPSQIISAVGIIVSTYVLIGLYDELDK